MTRIRMKTLERRMNRLPSWLLTCIAALALSTPLALAQDEPDTDPYVFAWPFVEGEMSPRGGTTKGPPVETVTETTEAFERLQADGLSKRERDRRAILAMAGTYRVSFDFLELVGYAPGFEPARPYRSWATEHVYVVGDSEKRISLQHILIMTIVGEDGEEMGPFVTKHWRQDWVYENPVVHTYRGFGSWARATKDEAERDGDWSQTVWQVDDSPRYAAWGEWRHTPERSWWTSEETWRPLPRREFSVRDDYDALVGTNTHIVLPTGWVHEQHNVKAVLGGADEIESRLARFDLVRTAKHGLDVVLFMHPAGRQHDMGVGADQRVVVVAHREFPARQRPPGLFAGPPRTLRRVSPFAPGRVARRIVDLPHGLRPTPVAFGLVLR